MIGRVLQSGQRVGGLLGYLYGPGRHHEHTDPHIVASWTRETVTLDPPLNQATGRRDFRNLVSLLHAPVDAMPAEFRPADPVYHVAVRNRADDRILSDAEWQDVAEQIMHDTGLARRDDPDGVRWIAVRHAPDHIHIVATLARADNRIARHENDWLLMRNTCKVFERRYGLVETASADRTAARRPTRAETEKARRAGRHETARERLRREVRVALAAATNEAEFFANLRTAGVMVRLRHSSTNPLEVTGYSVGLPDTQAAKGGTIWYGGGKLAADLTLPKIRHRWNPEPEAPAPADPKPADPGPAPAPQPTEAPTPPPAAEPEPQQAPSRPQRPRLSPAERRQIFDQAVRAVIGAAADIRRLQGTDPAAAAAIAYAASDTLTTAARILEGRRGGPLSHAADALDHATRPRNGHPEPIPPRAAPRTQYLRSSTRLLAAVRRVNPDDKGLQVAELMTQLASLSDTVADLRASQRRLAQANAARRAAELLREQAARYPAPTIAPTRPDRPTRRPTPPRRPTPRPGPGPAPSP
ncbi:hypothetical protein Lfu02_15000 [Longispora fulva]|uniref:MobA/VirD2-like nuclease domain-containing protein n=1 Tax=Longispora fulva TaxID=619741 RepID=A0A8J7KJJ8_9ACTN|nr:relaxase [Longispora fulva]MBG6140490.1 hypothetical protein [Longispora fulva]GIG57128.1 hypothetical protein Lfu02_15000 [Longispora fulva]